MRQTAGTIIEQYVKTIDASIQKIVQDMIETMYADDGAGLAAAPRELGLRALAQLLMAVSGQPYRPRFERLERLFDRVRDGTLGGGATLHGCRVAPVGGRNGAFGAGTLAIAPEPGRPRRGK